MCEEGEIQRSLLFRVYQSGDLYTTPLQAVRGGCGDVRRGAWYVVAFALITIACSFLMGLYVPPPPPPATWIRFPAASVAYSAIAWSPFVGTESRPCFVVDKTKAVGYNKRRRALLRDGWPDDIS